MRYNTRESDLMDVKEKLESDVEELSKSVCLSLTYSTP